MTRFQLDHLRVSNHLLSDDIDDLPAAFAPFGWDLAGRSMLVRKTTVVPIECVVRGYLAGSGWKEYRQHGTVCGIPLPRGLRECEALPEPIFTPATKAESGHDENISFDVMASQVGAGVAKELRDLRLTASSSAGRRNMRGGATSLLADTKISRWGHLPSGEAHSHRRAVC